MKRPRFGRAAYQVPRPGTMMWGQLHSHDHRPVLAAWAEALKIKPPRPARSAAMRLRCLLFMNMSFRARWWCTCRRRQARNSALALKTRQPQFCEGVLARSATAGRGRV